MKKTTNLYRKRNNRAEHYINPLLDNIELFSGRFSTYEFKPHFHKTYTIIFVEEGAADYSSGKNNLIIPSGRLVVFNPFEVHAGRAIAGQPWKFKTLYISEYLFQKATNLLGENLASPFFTQNLIADAPLFNMGTQVFQQLLFEKNFVNSEESLLRFLASLISKHATSSFNNKSLVNTDKDFQIATRVKAFLHKNYLENFTLKEIVQTISLDCDEFNLIRKFKFYHNLPPHQYQLNLRIEKSKELLLKRHSSTKIAYLLGFFDQSHFIRHFKKIVGITPKKYGRLCA